MVIGQIISLGINTVLIASLLILCLLSLVLLVEVIAALVPHASQPVETLPREQSIAVIVPAHNEEMGLRDTLATIQPQLRSNDRLIVIADNCTDQTASIAREMEATVIERHDSTRLGKGYAIDYGLSFLASEPPEIVILIDADCQVEPTAIETLAQRVWLTGHPVQATYLMSKPTVSSAKDGVSAFAFTVKNLVRSLGLSHLGLPCLLAGTGMAFPWTVIRSVNLANGHLVEDMKLSLDLTIAGYAPMYCPEARVIGNLPQQERAARSQRTRWEHGHLQSIVTYTPLLLKTAIAKLRLDALALALELSIPPLSLFVMLWLMLTTIALLWGLLTAFWLPAMVGAATGASLITAILSAWAKFGREGLPLKQLVSIPFYILWKIPLYLKFLVRPQQAWVRTERDALPASTLSKIED